MTTRHLGVDLSTVATKSRRWLQLLLVVVAAGCVARPVPTLDAVALNEIAEGYVRVALQLAQHNPDLVDAWRGNPDWRPGARVPVAPLHARVQELQHALAPVAAHATGANRDRARYLDGQLTALAVTAQRLLGQSLTFDEEARKTLGTTTTFRADSGGLASARKALADLWPGPGTLAARHAAYRDRLRVPADRVEAVMHAALAACRQVTTAAIPLPDDEGIDLVFGVGSQWDGFARYLGHHRTRIEINRDGALDVTRALRLACHEGYPGHHVQFILIDDELVRRRGWSEFGLVPGFGPHLMVTEGAAEAGAGLAFPPEQRTAIYRDVLLPAAGLPPAEAVRLVQVEDLIAALEPAIIEIARAYLDNTITQAAALERLRDEALTPEPAALLAFAERQRVRLLAYPMGHDAALQAVGGDGLKALRRLFVDHPFAVQ